MTVRVLAAGDNFVLSSLLTEQLAAHLAPGSFEVATADLPWPEVPFGPVGEVDEASGTESDIIAALEGAEVCVTQMAPITERVLEASPSLRLVCVSRGGPVNVNLDAATRHGVAVTSAPGRNAQATAEHTVAMMLAAIRRIPQTNSDLERGEWRGDYYRFDRVGLELENSTVGLIGYGAVGARVARILGGFGADVVVYDPYIDQERLGDTARKVTFDELLEGSAVVSLHARVTPETTGMLGRRQLEALAPGSVVVNCARGALLDYDALCDALVSGHLFGAAVDVFPEEPIPANSRLLTTPNLIKTPHLAGASTATARNAARIVAEEVARYVAGDPLLHLANADVRLDRASA